MSFNILEGWTEEFGYFSERGRRGIGQRLHHCCKKAKAYALPEGFYPRQWDKSWRAMRSVTRGCYFGPTIREARRREYERAMNRNPMYFANFVERPAAALRLGHPYGWGRFEAVQRRKEEQRLYSEETRSVAVTLHGFTWQEIEDLLANSEGPAMPENPEERTMEWLVTSLLAHWADGWRRPGSWERTMLDMMGHAND